MWKPQRSNPGWGIDTAGSDYSRSFPEHAGGPPDDAWLVKAQQPGENRVNHVVRYARPDGKVRDHDTPGGDWGGCWSLSKDELARYAFRDMPVIPMQFGFGPGDNVGAELGRRRGNAMAEVADKLGLPPGGHLGCDVEGKRVQAAGEVATRLFMDMFSRVLWDIGYFTLLYIGDDEVRPTGPGLYRLPRVNSYFGSYPAKRAPYMTPLPRGWSMLQGLPTRVHGLLCDWNEIVVDGKGETPMWYRWVAP